MKVQNGLALAVAAGATLSLPAATAQAARPVVASSSTSTANSASPATPDQLSDSSVQTVEKAITDSMPHGKLDATSNNSPPSISKNDPGEVSLGNISSSIVLQGRVTAQKDPQYSSVVKNGGNDFLINETADGAQVLLSIDSASSPHQRSFTVLGGKRLVPASTYGVNSEEKFVVDTDGRVNSSFDSPWAYDVKGRKVATRYEVQGNTLTQVVSPGANSQYPIVADPSFAKITTCAGTIVANAGLYIVPGGIVARLLARGNSIRRTATIIFHTVNAKSYNGKLKALRSLAFNIGADLTGIGAIAKACG